MHRVMKFNQEVYLVLYVDTKTELRKKITSKKKKCKLINTAFRKTMENVRKHRDTEIATTEAKMNYLVLKPNYHKTNFF